jgi:hypothetical protein
MLIHGRPLALQIHSLQPHPAAGKIPGSLDQPIDLDHKYEFSSWVQTSLYI